MSNGKLKINPSNAVLIKLASLIIHYQEYTSSNGHPLDKVAIDSLESDKEIIDWFNGMNKFGLLPVKRNK